MDKNFGALFSEIKKDLTSYLDLRMKVLHLEVLEKSSVVSSILLYSLIILFTGFFTILFVFLALGLYLGEVLGSNVAGIGLVAFLYIIVLIIALAKRSQIQSWLVNLFLGEMRKDEERDEQENT